MRSESEILEMLRSRVAEALEQPVESVDIDADLSELGLDSIKAFHLAGDLAEWLDQELSPTLLWEYANLRELAQGLYREQTES